MGKLFLQHCGVMKTGNYRCHRNGRQPFPVNRLL
jgi:hypothetical protein